MDLNLGFKIVQNCSDNIWLNIFSGMKFRLGICVPTALSNPDIPVYEWLSMAGKWDRWRDMAETQNGVIEANSLQDLDDDASKNVFFDREKRYLSCCFL